MPYVELAREFQYPKVKDWMELAKQLSLSNIWRNPNPGEGVFPPIPNLRYEDLAKGLWSGLNMFMASDPTMGMINPLQIRAFHGSPYRFQKFSNEAVGTGEGAQAFGYGHYLTESPEVAKYYATAKNPYEIGRASCRERV